MNFKKKKIIINIQNVVIIIGVYVRIFGVNKTDFAHDIREKYPRISKYIICIYT